MYNYRKLPFLLSEIIYFFHMESKDGKIVHKQVFQFCSYYTQKYHLSEMIQPRNIDLICTRMYQLGIVSLVKAGTAESINNEYLTVDRAKLEFNEYARLYDGVLRMRVFGFESIVEFYSERVLPLLHVNQEGQMSVATSFILYGGIVTAKHCIENAKEISIKSFSKEQLSSAVFYTHMNTNLDLVYIKIEGMSSDSLDIVGSPSELDEVITMGFPKIPGFTHFMTKEKALISSLPSSRMSKSIGSISAIADEIFAKEALFLITAKIRGGNSGGPVINSSGEIVGVSTETPLVDSKDYDDLGYGVAVPITFVKEITDGKSTILDCSSIMFKDFVE